jgi:hypothetical protein
VATNSASRALMAGFASPALISWLSLSMISGGVPLGTPTLPEQTRHYVGTRTSRDADNDAHRPRRINLRPRGPREGWESDSACQMQKLTVQKSHGVLPAR